MQFSLNKITMYMLDWAGPGINPNYNFNFVFCSSVFLYDINLMTE